MEGRQTQQSTEFLFHTMLMSHEASHHMCIMPGKPMRVIKIIVFIRALRAIEPFIFVALFSSYFLEQYHIFTLPRKGYYFFGAWGGLELSEGRIKSRG